MVINNSGSENFSTQGVQSRSSNQEISFEIRVFLGVFISVLSIVGTVGNTIVITVLRLKNIFTRKTTGLILTSLAVVDLLCSTVEIPLAICTMIVRGPDDHLYNLSLTQQALGPCVFWGYTTSFFLLSIDRNDALRKISYRQQVLTTKRVLVAIIIAMAFGVGLALFFLFTTENPYPLLPRQTASVMLTSVRGGLFLLFLLSVSSNIYYFVQIKKLLREHSEITGDTFSQQRRNRWKTRERNLSWRIIQVILVVSFSYVPYTIASIIHNNAEIHSLNSIALCRSLTYLKCAANVFIFTKLDRRFIMVFFDKLRGKPSLNIVHIQPLSQRVSEAVTRKNNPAFESTCSKNRQHYEKMVVNRAMKRSSDQRIERHKQDERTKRLVKAKESLPVITITSPSGKTTIIKGKNCPHVRAISYRRNKNKSSVRGRSKTV